MKGIWITQRAFITPFESAELWVVQRKIGGLFCDRDESFTQNELEFPNFRKLLCSLSPTREQRRKCRTHTASKGYCTPHVKDAIHILICCRVIFPPLPWKCIRTTDSKGNYVPPPFLWIPPCSRKDIESLSSFVSMLVNTSPPPWIRIPEKNGK